MFHDFLKFQWLSSWKLREKWQRWSFEPSYQLVWKKIVCLFLNLKFKSLVSAIFLMTNFKCAYLCFYRFALQKIADMKFYYKHFFFYKLKHFDIVTSYGDIDLGQHWLRWWLVAWRHLRPISQEVLKISLRQMNLRNTLVKSFYVYQGPMS